MACAGTAHIRAVAARTTCRIFQKNISDVCPGRIGRRKCNRKVCDYIHLNPVRARVVPAHRIAEFTASSLSHWLKRTAPAWLYPTDLLREAVLDQTGKPWPHYTDHLMGVTIAGGDDERVTQGALSITGRQR